ncbi:MAG: TrmH family RNA methyltransferase [Bdellovibrionales bacterium]
MKIHIVLVRTEYAANLGAAARAIANMGCDRLILVDPRCEVNSKAKQMAAGAQEQLRTLRAYPSWEDFYAHEGDGIRIALTRRGGRKRKVEALEERLGDLGPELPGHLYLIFGPEADGLQSEDLAFVNFACHLPVYGEFASLNLAQAVLLAGHMVRSRFPPEFMPKQVTGEAEDIVSPFYFPDQLIKDWLVAMGFDVRARRSSAYLTLRRLFLQNRPTRHEIQVLESILQQNIRKLQESREPRSIGLAFEQMTDDFRDIPVQDI